MERPPRSLWHRALYSCGFIPVIIVTALVTWSVKVWITEVLRPVAEQNTGFGLALACVYTGLLTMFMGSYFTTVFTSAGEVPPMFNQDTAYDENDNLRMPAAPLDVLSRNEEGDFRYCKKCLLFKPQRCHHCSVCGRCVLKMDHHCPWVNNCVGAGNYKFFFLFVSYGLAFCTFVAVTIAPRALQLGVLPENAEAMMVFGLAIGFSVALLFFVGFHSYLVVKNRTTLEMGEDDNKQWDLGVTRNILEVFGTSPPYWFLPIHHSSECDGVHFFRKLAPGLSV